MSFLMTTRDDEMIDVDGIWEALGALVTAPEPPSPPGHEHADGARMGLVIGLRLAFDEPLIARAVMQRYETHISALDVNVTPEAAEEALRDILGALIKLITL